MESIVLHAHYDGSQIRLDDPIELRPGTRLLITVIQPDDDMAAWHELSLRGLAAAYDAGEQDYAPSLVRDAAWDAVATRRDAEINAGLSAEAPVDEVLAKLRTELR